MRIYLVFFGLLVIFCSCQVKGSANRPYLKTVLDKLDEIRSSRYNIRKEAWNPGDTAAIYSQGFYAYEYVNDEDTTIGSNWLYLKMDGLKSFESSYDGNMIATVYEDQKMIRIDSFNTRDLPFRPIQPPFYNYTKSIIRYILTTGDSISLVVKDLDKSLHLELTIYEDKQIEFFGRAYKIPKPPFEQTPLSKYELWIDKSIHLPFKVRREMSHNISIQEVYEPTFNVLDAEDFDIMSYLPADYDLGIKRKRISRENTHSLLNKKAPDWSLLDYNGNNITLSSIESKATLLQFTSVNCGPCTASIPFLKRLDSLYVENDLKLIAIESYSRNSVVLEKYSVRNDFSYPFLLSERKLNNPYSITFTPIFFLLDQDHIVKKVYHGYGGKSTDKLIFEAINKLVIN